MSESDAKEPSRPTQESSHADSTAPLGGSTIPPSQIGSKDPERIGPYRITKELGRGGMGVVFLAVDPKLGRQIAIKVLSERFAADPAGLARFDREAKLLAALNHPNVATIHAFEESDSIHYITMEFIPGESLAERSACGPLPVEESMRVTRQVAAALEAAHESGVIHRDLKPGNVRVRPDGRVIVLDFGLAKALAISEAQPLSEPDAVTSPGTVLGTPGYMSPEQLRGELVDHRADVWAFGCVLYECLSGAPAFPGPTPSVRIAASLEREPDWSLIPPDTPDRLSCLLRDCLAKRPDDRLGEIALARRAIEECLAPGRFSSVTAVSMRNRAPRKTNLPPTLTSFVGREQTRADVTQQLMQSRLLTLTGAGGSGKSRLALEIAGDVLGEFADGVWWIELAPVSDAALVPQTIATALAVRERPGLPVKQAVHEHVREKSLLLVLDNCEHMVEACADLVTEMLGPSPDVRVLATSRESLGIVGERICRLSPLRIPDDLAARSLKATRKVESVQLFEDRARALEPDFAVAADNVAAVAEICRRLDGIPLAIELAAARINVLTPGEIAQRLEQRFSILTGGGKGGQTRHRTLRELVDWSHEQLTGPERIVFRRLAAFRGGWTLEAAEAVCAGGGVAKWEVLDLFSHLVQKSVVERDAVAGEPGGPARYRMLETIREYAKERLERSGDLPGVAIRHRDYYLALAKAGDRALRARESRKPGEHDQAIWLERLERDHGNLRSALRTCLQEDAHFDGGVRLASALSFFWWFRGYYEEGLAWYQRLLADPRGKDEPEGRIGLLAQAAWLAMWQTDYTKARVLADEAVTVGRTLRRDPELSTAVTVRGALAMYEGDLGRAADLFGESLEIAERIGVDGHISASLGNLAEVAYRRGLHAESRRLYTRSADLVRKRGDRWALSENMRMLARVALREGKHDEARALGEEALIIARDFRDSWSVAQSLESLAMLATVEERHGGATRLLGAASALREEAGVPWSPAEQDEFAEVLLVLRSGLGEAAFEEQWSAGRIMSLEQAVEGATKRTP